MTDLSIVIVSHNTQHDLEVCLRSIRDARPVVSHEVIVVDNASSDASADAARRFEFARVIRSDTNVGFAAGTNLGIRSSGGQFLLLLNSDTIVPPGSIDTLLAELCTHPEAAVAGPRLVDAEGRAELSFGRMMSPWTEFWQRRLVRSRDARDSATLKRVDGMTRQMQWPDWVSGACLLVRREDAEAVGLLDERYFMYTEDVDFCAAIRSRGRKILFTPAAEIVHLRGRSAASAPGATRAAYRDSHIAFYEKHHPWLAPLLRAYLRLKY